MSDTEDALREMGLIPVGPARAGLIVEFGPLHIHITEEDLRERYRPEHLKALFAGLATVIGEALP